MLLSDLKKICAAYHQKTTADLTIDSVDLFLVAANNARKQAEMLHNFELARVFGTLELDGANGGALSDVSLTGTSFGGAVTGSGAPTGYEPIYDGDFTPIGTFNSKTLYAKYDGTGIVYVLQYIDDLNGPGLDGWTVIDGSLVGSIFADRFQLITSSASPAGTYSGVNALAGETWVVAEPAQTYSGIKEVKAVYRTRADGTLVPVDFSNPEVQLERDRRELEFADDFSYTNRYPSDAQLLMAGSSSGIIQRNRRLYIYPGDPNAVEPVTVTLESYGWLSDYTSSELSDTVPSDFFLEHCAEYMMWACICELNYLFQTFVPRVEGALTPPEKKREEAWNQMLLWDSYMVDSNTTRSR